ncbi:unnamed protein product [Phytomonas sp. EM1]|nr:unnamed protein product [Phytomonas sp. EM1]|eukprot:CCW62430.1 unnamed protein product [Phytomonas sp. isolate EM1]
MSDLPFHPSDVAKKRRRAREKSPLSSVPERPTSCPRKEESIPRGGSSQGVFNINPPRSPSCRTRSPQWHYTNAHSCLLCGRMNCTCPTPRPDPDEVRQKLGSLRLNTPYERAKVARHADTLRHDESRRRQRLVKLFEVGYSRLQQAERTARQIIVLNELESGNRQTIILREKRERAGYLNRLDKQATLAAMTHHERERRQYISTLERMERVGLVSQAYKSEKISYLNSREACSRQTILFSESGERNGLFAAHLDFMRGFRSGELAVRQLWMAFCQSREGLEKECATELEMILDTALTCRRCIIDSLAQRTAMLESAVKTLRDISEEERDARHHIREEMMEEGHCVEERTRLFLWQRSGLEKMELSVRQSIVEEMESWLQQLHVECSRAKWEVEEAAHHMQEERERALQNALTVLSAIAQEELGAFASLLERKAREHEKRLLWIEEKERSQATFIQRSTAAREFILIEEDRARQNLMRDFEKGEMNILEWVTLIQRRQQEMWAEVEAEKVEIAKQEHERRLHLMFLMASEEESIHRWVHFQMQVLQKKIHEEANERRLLLQQESVDFGLLTWHYSTEMEAHAARLQERNAQRTNLEQGCLAYREMICKAEESEWQRLLSVAQQNHRRIWTEYKQRHRLELLHAESHARADICRREVEHRQELCACIVVAQQQYNQELEPLFATQRAGVVAAEKEARLSLVQEIENDYESMYVSERQEQLELVLEAERQIQEKLYVIQSCQCEDARLYDEQELLPDPVADGDENAILTGLSSIDAGYASNMKLELMLRALGNPTIVRSSLSRESIDSAMQVIDIVNGKRAKLQDELKCAEKSAQNAAKRLTQVETMLAEAKERKEAYASKQSRNAQAHERRLAMDKLERDRGEEEIEANRQLLMAALSKLEANKNALEFLRTSINKQYGR